MPLVYNGNAANVTYFNSKSIANVYAETPVRIATTAPHGFSSYDQVEVSGTSIVDGLWAILVIDSTHFTVLLDPSVVDTSQPVTIDMPVFYNQRLETVENEIGQ